MSLDGGKKRKGTEALWNWYKLRGSRKVLGKTTSRREGKGEKE